MVKIGTKYVNPNAIIALDEWWEYAQDMYDDDRLKGTKILLVNDTAIYVKLPVDKVNEILDTNKGVEK